MNNNKEEEKGEQDEEEKANCINSMTIPLHKKLHLQAALKSE